MDIKTCKKLLERVKKIM